MNDALAIPYKRHVRARVGLQLPQLVEKNRFIQNVSRRHELIDRLTRLGWRFIGMVNKDGRGPARCLGFAPWPPLPKADLRTIRKLEIKTAMLLLEHHGTEVPIDGLLALQLYAGRLSEELATLRPRKRDQLRQLVTREEVQAPGKALKELASHTAALRTGSLLSSLAPRDGTQNLAVVQSTGLAGVAFASDTPMNTGKNIKDLASLKNAICSDANGPSHEQPLVVINMQTYGEKRGYVGPGRIERQDDHESIHVETDGENRITLVHIPIEDTFDQGADYDPTTLAEDVQARLLDGAAEVVRQLAQAKQDKPNALAHCRGGYERTSTILACTELLNNPNLSDMSDHAIRMLAETILRSVGSHNPARLPSAEQIRTLMSPEFIARLRAKAVELRAELP